MNTGLLGTVAGQWLLEAAEGILQVPRCCVGPSAHGRDTSCPLPLQARVPSRISAASCRESVSCFSKDSHWLRATSNYFHSGSPKHLKQSFKLRFRIKGNTANRHVVNMPKNRKVISLSAVVSVAVQRNVSIPLCFCVYCSRLCII